MQLTRRLDANNDIQFGHGLADFVTGAESVAQNVKTRLSLLRGEWFLDTDAGVPWLQQMVGIEPPDLLLTESQIKATIIDTDGVAGLDAFDLTLDSRTRRLTVTARVVTDDGTAAEISATL